MHSEPEMTTIIWDYLFSTNYGALNSWISSTYGFYSLDSGINPIVEW